MKIGISRAISLLQSSKIESTKDNAEFQELKGFIATAMNEKQNRDQGIKIDLPMYGTEELVSKVNRSTMKREDKDLIIKIIGGKR